MWLVEDTGWGSGCSDYLRTSCREALISLPRSHSTGLGLSHLQCKAERMGRGERIGRGEQGVEGVGKHCINTHSLTLLSHVLRYRQALPLHAQIMSHGNIRDKREDPIQGDEQTHYLPFFFLRLLNAESERHLGKADGRQSRPPCWLTFLQRLALVGDDKVDFIWLNIWTKRLEKIISRMYKLLYM